MVSVGSLATKTLAFAKIRPPCDSAYPCWSGASWCPIWSPMQFSPAGNNCERKKPTRWSCRFERRVPPGLIAGTKYKKQTSMATHRDPPRLMVTGLRMTSRSSPSGERDRDRPSCRRHCPGSGARQSSEAICNHLLHGRIERWMCGEKESPRARRRLPSRGYGY
jgi:hypothetical protein